MTAKEWVESTLASHLEADSNGNTVIRLTAEQTVTVDTFCVFFGAAIENNPADMHTALSGAQTFDWGDPPASVTRTTAVLGYQTFIDQWHAEGLF